MWVFWTSTEKQNLSVAHFIWTHATPAVCSLLVWSRWNGWIRKYSRRLHSGEESFFQNFVQSFFFTTAGTRREWRTNDSGHDVLFKKVWVNLLIPIKQNFTQRREAGTRCTLNGAKSRRLPRKSPSSGRPAPIFYDSVLLMKAEASGVFFTFCLFLPESWDCWWNHWAANTFDVCNIDVSVLIIIFW